jgi:hypothetical protein
LAEDHHVGIGNHPLGVELERIEHERATEQIVTDHDATGSQPGFGNERVGRPEIARRHLVGRDPWAEGTEHQRERSPDNDLGSFNDVI